jgi:hypothetical protein
MAVDTLQKIVQVEQTQHTLLCTMITSSSYVVRAVSLLECPVLSAYAIATSGSHANPCWAQSLSARLPTRSTATWRLPRD